MALKDEYRTLVTSIIDKTRILESATAIKTETEQALAQATQHVEYNTASLQADQVALAALEVQIFGA
jgi:hypothetical protein